MKLRPYQEKLKAGVYDAWSNGAQNVVAVMPTGAGKGHTSADIIREHQGQSCTIAHRQELVAQLCIHLGRQGVPHRIHAPKNVIQSIIREERVELGRSFYDPNALASVAGVDTLVSRADTLDRWAKQVTLWTVDECHHIASNGIGAHGAVKDPNKWFRATQMFPNAKGLGVTATPQRADGKGLGRHAHGVFDAMILGPTMRELIEMGSLCDYRIVVPPSDYDLNRLKTGSTGDYTQASLKDASKHSHITGDVVTNYKKFADGTQAIVFATDVETANDIAAQFRDAGIPSQSVNAKTHASVRSDFIRRFRRGEIKVLVNVDLFGEGFDLPAIETVIMARPTMSLGLYLQMLGRGLRPLPGKTYAIIIDHVSNVKQHGLPDINRRWSLDAREKRSSTVRDPEVVPVTTCMSCNFVYERVKSICPFCGHKPEPEARRKPEQVDGDLIMLDADVLDAMRRAAVLDSPEEVANRASYVAGPIAGRAAAKHQAARIEEQQRLRDTIAMWAGVQRNKGRSDEESYRRFYLTYGIDVLSALAMNRADAEKLRQELEKGIKS